MVYCKSQFMSSVSIFERFFFKQKTAYEMRISDWSSDVCSSDLLPDLTAIDMRTDPPDRGRWLAPPLVDALADRLHKGEQSLLFLNRRGFAPLTLCRTCGHRIQCPNCTAWMVEHRLVHRLACHHFGHVLRSEEHTSELQSLMRISYAVFCLKK